MKKFKMPSAMIIVFFCLFIVAVLTWIIPTSVVIEEDGVSKIIYNAIMNEDGEIIYDAGTNPVGIWDIFLAPVLGFIEAGAITFTILISGSFLAILNRIGALDAGIGALLKKFTGNVLIAILMLTFALMGTVYGSWEELPAYALVIVPLFVTAGYDVITGLAVLFLGATIGNMASIVNPYSTGAAVAAIGNDSLSLGSGISLRLVLFFVLYNTGVIYVTRYASKVKADKTKSVLYGVDGVKTLVDDSSELAVLTKRRFISLVIFIFMIILLVMGYIPWSSMPIGNNMTMYDIVNTPVRMLASIPFLGNFFGFGSVTPFGDWYFNEFSVLFILGSIVIAFINKLTTEEFVEEVVQGAKDLLGVVLVLSIAKAISVIMGTSTSGMSVTFVYWIQSVLQGVPSYAFAIACLLAYAGVGLFIQSTSGVSGITMPILGAVAMGLFSSTAIGTVGGQIILISAFTVGVNFVTGFYPGATIMGTLELVNVPYDKFLKFMLKILLPLMAIAAIILSLAPVLGLV